MSRPFRYVNNLLFCEEIDLNQLAASRPTPFFIYSKQELQNNCRDINQAGEGYDFLPCYALKANYNPTLLAIIRDMGFGADVVSGGELQFALKFGFPPEKIVFAGVGKTAHEIELAIRSDIHSLNIESEQELELTGQIAARVQKTVRFSIRVNPDIDAQTHKYISTGIHTSKFGVTTDQALKLYEKARDHRWLDPKGIHVHIGSQIVKSGPYLATVDFLHRFAEDLKLRGIELEYLDLGGGIGINYQDDFSDPTAPSTYIKEILPVYLNGFKDLNLKLIVELGRSVIGSTGLLISSVLYQKQTPLKNFLIVDAAMNNLIRPSLYSAHHEIVPLQKKPEPFKTYDVVGPVCESGDFLGKDRSLPEMSGGDLLAVGGAGAYGQALSSNYNLRPRIAEYLVDGSSLKTIYKGETINDIAAIFGI